jgi:Flp pilus assembly protein TadB
VTRAPGYCVTGSGRCERRGLGDGAGGRWRGRGSRMSKERARRRAARQALAARAAAKRARVQARRARWRGVRRRVLAPLDRRRAWLLGRRRPRQRLAALVLGAGLVFAVWYFVDSWPTRVALILLLVLVVPLLVVILFPRKVS